MDLMVDLLKFTSNKKIFSEVVVLGYNQICSKTLSKKKFVNGFIYSPSWIGGSLSLWDCYDFMCFVNK